MYTVCRDLDTCTTRATCTSDHHHTRLSPSAERVGGIGEVLILPVPACRNLAARPVSKPCSGSYFSLSQRRRNTCNGARNPRDPAQKIPAPIGPLTGQLAFGIPVIGICGRLSKSASCIAGAGLGPLVTGVGLAAVKCLASAYLVPSAPFVDWNKLCVGKAHPYPKKRKTRDIHTRHVGGGRAPRPVAGARMVFGVCPAKGSPAHVGKVVCSSLEGCGTEESLWGRGK